MLKPVGQSPGVQLALTGAGGGGGLASQHSFDVQNLASHTVVFELRWRRAPQSPASHTLLEGQHESPAPVQLSFSHGAVDVVAVDPAAQTMPDA
jgi:hypothetical protein